MNGIEYELQVAMLQRLKSDPRLAAAGVPAYDYIPDTATMPYIAIEEITASPYRSKTFNGLEVTASLSILSEALGQGEIKKIMALVRAALIEPLQLREGHEVDYQDISATNLITFNDEDVVINPVYQGVISYTFRIKEGDGINEL